MRMESWADAKILLLMPTEGRWLRMTCDDKTKTTPEWINQSFIYFFLLLIRFRNFTLNFGLSRSLFQFYSNAN